MYSSTPAKLHDFTRQGFTLHSLPWLLDNCDLLTDSQQLPCYEIIWLRSGSGTVMLDYKMRPLLQEAVYCFAPGQMRHFHFAGKVLGCRLSFSPDFFFFSSNHSAVETWLDGCIAECEPAVLETDGEMRDELEGIFSKMQKELQHEHLLRFEILSGLLNILLIHFSRRVFPAGRGGSVSSDQHLVHRFKALLKKHFTDRKFVAEYAGDLCVTANYLNRTVKKVTGLTASHHIQQQVILEAKRLAIYSGTSMKEIAYRLGFDNLAHFSKFFKNKCGMSFTCFKKSALSMTDLP